jgi:hypothetical protein
LKKQVNIDGEGLLRKCNGDEHPFSHLPELEPMFVEDKN